MAGDIEEACGAASSGATGAADVVPSAGSGTGIDELETQLEGTGPAGKDNSVHLISRIGCLWEAHVKGSENSSLVSADRLTQASAYRLWAKTATLGLVGGEEIPLFTEVWLAIESASKKKAKAAAKSHGDDKARIVLVGKAQKGERYTEAGALQLLREVLTDILSGGRELPFNASLVTDTMQRKHRGFKLSMTPFGRLGEMLKKAEEHGWLGTARSADDVLVSWLDEDKIKRLMSEDTRDSGDASDGNISDSREAVVLTRAAKASEETDLLAEFAAEGSRMQKNVDEELRGCLDQRAAQAGHRDVRLRDAHASRQDWGTGAEDAPTCERSRSPRRGARDSERHAPTSYTAAGEDDAASEFTQADCVKMFDDALWDVCKQGLYHELPMNASVVSDRMRKMHRGWNISRTPFQRFHELLVACEAEGIIQTRRGYGRRKDDVLITWVKHNYHVVNRSRSRGEGKRGEERPQGRGGEQLGGGRGGGGKRGDDREEGEEEEEEQERTTYHSGGRERDGSHAPDWGDQWQYASDPPRNGGGQSSGRERRDDWGKRGGGGGGRRENDGQQPRGGQRRSAGDVVERSRERGGRERERGERRHRSCAAAGVADRDREKKAARSSSEEYETDDDSSYYSYSESSSLSRSAVPRRRSRSPPPRRQRAEDSHANRNRGGHSRRRN